MTPLEMAKKFCSNYGFGGCDNIIITDDLRLVRRDPLQRCLLSLGKGCDFFEETVLPGVPKETQKTLAKGSKSP